MNRILAKIVFYALIAGIIFAGAHLYIKTRLEPAAAIQQPATGNQQPTCIITVDGQKYDVESLRSTHTGGDVFTCGTDMSDVFHKQHDDNLRMIQKYLVK